MSLQNKNRKDLNPTRKNFFLDIRKLLTEMTKKHSNIAPSILGDWNETMSDNETSGKPAEKNGLVEVWEHQHQDNDFSTHTRGCRQIDHASAPPELSSMTQISCKPFHSRSKGDHRAFFWRCKNEICLEANLNPIKHWKAGN